MPRLLLSSSHVPFISAIGLVCLLLAVLVPWGGTAETATKPLEARGTVTATRPGPKAVGQAPVYVGAYSVDHEFKFVTEKCMKIIRSKKILFGSRSWGLGLGTTMARKDKKYEVVWRSRSRQRVNDKERVLKADAFDQPGVVHYVFDFAPRRWVFMDDFLRKDPWKFGGKVDGAFQSLYCGPTKEAKQMADEYFPMLDKLIKDFPNVKFAILTHPVSGDGVDLRGKNRPAASGWNIGGGDYSDEAVKRYYGRLPILDIRDIVSTHANGKPCTFEHNGKTYRKLCPEYNVNKDLIHPNTPEARERMGKGFILLLAKMFCPDMLPPLNTPKPEILKEGRTSGDGAVLPLPPAERRLTDPQLRRSLRDRDPRIRLPEGHRLVLFREPPPRPYEPKPGELAFDMDRETVGMLRPWRWSGRSPGSLPGTTAGDTTRPLATSLPTTYTSAGAMTSWPVGPNSRRRLSPGVGRATGQAQGRSIRSRIHNLIHRRSTVNSADDVHSGTDQT